MELGLYILSAAFLILLILYIINVRIDKNFRKKMVPLLKKQKATIDELENEKDQLTNRSDDLSRELKVLQTKFSRQDEE